MGRLGPRYPPRFWYDSLDTVPLHCGLLPIGRDPMKPVEKTLCPSCQRPVWLSYVETRAPDLHDHWTCPHDGCRVRHPSSRQGHVVIAVAGPDQPAN